MVYSYLTNRKVRSPDPGPVEMLFKLMKEKKRNALKAEVENSQ